ncbi:MAG: hypothetical protein HOP08_00600 [Cyclobacteriaceae bacterium]|nr:hypothetical protein [Cyclobacteriaceae bacterium]
MNEENVKYLKDSLLYTGFGDKLNDALVAQIKNQPKDFQLSTQMEYKSGDVTEKVDYKLDFRKSDTTDMYFFNRYQAELKNEDTTKEKAQTFYINKDFTITAKEAFNLLSGRAVNKDMKNKDEQPYNAWLQLDFSKKDEQGRFEMKRFSEGYGFNLEAVVNRYPIKELDSNDTRARLLTSLEKGNLQSVTFVKDGKEDKMHVAANPQFKSLYLYDANMKKVYQGNEKKEQPENGRPSQGEEKKEKKEVKAKSGEEEEGATQKSSSRKRVRA